MFSVLLFILVLSACGTNSVTSSTHNSATNGNIVETDKNTLTPTAGPTPTVSPTITIQTESDDYDYVLDFPSDSYPETALHIYSAIENGHSDVCTIDRDGADANRKKSLAGIDTKEGYDRDEWPMAMCAEGGVGADIAYIHPSDNRGAGSWVGHQLSAYEDGEKVLFIVEKPKNLFGNKTSTDLNIDEDVTPTTNPDKQDPNPNTSESNSTGTTTNIVYKNCTEVREAGAAPIYRGDPGYSKKLDRDGDGIACEL